MTILSTFGPGATVYIEGSHPHIIEPEEFDAVSLEIARRKNLSRPITCSSAFAAKIMCGECGGWYGEQY